jgi:hypothetical protein
MTDMFALSVRLEGSGYGSSSGAIGRGEGSFAKRDFARGPHPRSLGPLATA